MKFERKIIWRNPNGNLCVYVRAKLQESKLILSFLTVWCLTIFETFIMFYTSFDARALDIAWRALNIINFWCCFCFNFLWNTQVKKVKLNSQTSKAELVLTLSATSATFYSIFSLNMHRSESRLVGLSVEVMKSQLWEFESLLFFNWNSRVFIRSPLISSLLKTQ